MTFTLYVSRRMPADSSASFRHIPDDADEHTLLQPIPAGPKFGNVLAPQAAVAPRSERDLSTAAASLGALPDKAWSLAGRFLTPRCELFYFKRMCWDAKSRKYGQFG